MDCDDQSIGKSAPTHDSVTNLFSNAVQMVGQWQHEMVARWAVHGHAEGYDRDPAAASSMKFTVETWGAAPMKAGIDLANAVVTRDLDAQRTALSDISDLSKGDRIKAVCYANHEYAKIAQDNHSGVQLPPLKIEPSLTVSAQLNSLDLPGGVTLNETTPVGEERRDKPHVPGLFQHVHDTWKHVLSGESTTAEKLEFGAEAAGLAAAAVVATRFKLTAILGSTGEAKFLAHTATECFPKAEIVAASRATEFSGAGSEFLSKKTLAEVAPIESAGSSILSRDTIPEFVESPLVESATALYDKNIRTVMSGANLKNGPDSPAHIIIDYATLSSANKVIAERIGQITSFGGRKYAVLKMPVHSSTPVSHIESHFSQVVSEFKPQPLTWGHYSEADYKSILGLDAEAKVDLTKLAKQSGHAYSAEHGLVFENAEYLKKFIESQSL